MEFGKKYKESKADLALALSFAQPSGRTAYTYIGNLWYDGQFCSMERRYKSTLRLGTRNNYTIRDKSLNTRGADKIQTYWRYT